MRASGGSAAPEEDARQSRQRTPGSRAPVPRRSSPRRRACATAGCPRGAGTKNRALSAGRSPCGIGTRSESERQGELRRVVVLLDAFVEAGHADTEEADGAGG